MIGSISSSTAVAIAVSVAATAVVLMLLAAAVSLRRSARALQELAEDLDNRASSTLAELDDEARQARAELDRVHDVIGTSQLLTETSRKAQAAVAGPFIKLIAAGAGTRTAGKAIKNPAKAMKRQPR